MKEDDNPSKYTLERLVISFLKKSFKISMKLENDGNVKLQTIQYFLMVSKER